MPKQLALFSFILFILWLFIRDKKLHPMTSWALWIPLLWIMIIGSRPVSAWFGAGINVESPEEYLEGSPFDRNVFLALIIAALLVLLLRRVNWRLLFASNRWLVLFFIYFGISVFWSDYPFVSFKRWTKDVGNIAMVLIILTEVDPAQALKAVFARFTNVAIPLSLLFVKYFPEIGRYYNPFTWEPSLCGIASEKNGLGCIVFICGLFLIWDFFESRAAGKKYGGADLFCRAVLMLMVVWLIVSAHSATSAICLILGTVILLLMRYPFARRQLRYLGTYSLVAGLLILVIYAFPGILETFVEMAGRNMTLTGRTDLWADLWNIPINSLFGTGYQSFWLGPRIELLWQKYPFHPNQAHNGYLETYLNGGLVGVSLLMAMIVSTGSKLRKALLAGSSEGLLRFAFFITILIYNWTEAMFYGINLIWITLLIAALSYPRSYTEAARNSKRAYA